MNDKKNNSCLIIDDEETVQSNLGELLDRTKLFKMIFHCYDGIDAGWRLSNQNFDIVIVDKNLPKRDGITLLKNEILSGRLDPKKVIVISGLFLAEDIVRMKELRLEHILVKPFKSEDISNKIKQILKI
jgi:two-component system OmpR family response regulator